MRVFANYCGRAVLRFTSRPYAPVRGTTIVFAPHQDDETIGCGALIARKRNEGTRVCVVFLTDGTGSHPGHPRITPPEVGAIRQHEARIVLATLGVDPAAIWFLNEPDGTLDRVSFSRRESLVARISALLVQMQPTEIFLPCREEGSSEHDAAFQFIAEAIDRAGTRAVVWEYPVWLWWNPLALMKRLLRSPAHYRAQAEDSAPIKRLALSQYRSQFEPIPPQTEPALPRNFLQFVDPQFEYFFRYTPPSQIPSTAEAG